MLYAQNCNPIIITLDFDSAKYFLLIFSMLGHNTASNPTQPMLISSCLFELDGGHVELDKFHLLAWSRIVRDLGIETSKVQIKQLEEVPDERRIEVIQTWIRPELDKVKVNDFISKKNVLFDELVKDVSRDDIIPGALDFIRHLKDLGLFVGLLSMHENSQVILDKVRTSDLFDEIFTIQANKGDKLSLNACSHIFKASGVNPNETIVFQRYANLCNDNIVDEFHTIGIGRIEKSNPHQIILSSFENLNLSKLVVDLSYIHVSKFNSKRET